MQVVHYEQLKHRLCLEVKESRIIIYFPIKRVYHPISILHICITSGSLWSQPKNERVKATGVGSLLTFQRSKERCISRRLNHKILTAALTSKRVFIFQAFICFSTDGVFGFHMSCSLTLIAITDYAAYEGFDIAIVDARWWNFWNASVIDICRFQICIHNIDDRRHEVWPLDTIPLQRVTCKVQIWVQEDDVEVRRMRLQMKVRLHNIQGI